MWSTLTCITSLRKTRNAAGLVVRNRHVWLSTSFGRDLSFIPSSSNTIGREFIITRIHWVGPFWPPRFLFTSAIIQRKDHTFPRPQTPPPMGRKFVMENCRFPSPVFRAPNPRKDIISGDYLVLQSPNNKLSKGFWHQKVPKWFIRTRKIGSCGFYENFRAAKLIILPSTMVFGALKVRFPDFLRYFRPSL